MRRGKENDNLPGKAKLKQWIPKPKLEEKNGNLQSKNKEQSKNQATSRKSHQANRSSRQAKRRKLTEVKSVMPKTPTKRAAIYKALIESPSTRNLLEDQGILTSPEESEEAAVAVAALRDARVC